MHRIGFLGTFLAFCGMAVAQTTVISGFASESSPPGYYAGPFVPLVSTPSVTLDPVSLVVGASNGTFGNVAGASNATQSINSAGPSANFAQPQWSNEMSSSSQQEEMPEAARSPVRPINDGLFQSGVASFQDSYGVAQLLKESRPAQHATHVYTNSDIARVNHTNGIVTFGDKTERVN